MVAWYFLLAFVITWSLQLPALLAARHVIEGPADRYMALVGLGAFGPMAAAMIASRIEGTGIRALFRPLSIWRVGARWYLAALALPGGIFVVAAGAYDLLGGHGEPLLYPPNDAAYLLAALVFPFGEEIGWRGFAFPRLRDRVGPLGASVVIGIAWTFWHVPMLTLQGVAPWLYAVFVPFMVGGSILFAWIYQRTGGSLLLAVLTHVGAHLNNPGHAMPARWAPMVIHTVAYTLLAVILLRADPGAWSWRASDGITSAPGRSGPHRGRRAP